MKGNQDVTDEVTRSNRASSPTSSYADNENASGATSSYGSYHGGDVDSMTSVPTETEIQRFQSEKGLAGKFRRRQQEESHDRASSDTRDSLLSSPDAASSSDPHRMESASATGEMKDDESVLMRRRNRNMKRKRNVLGSDDENDVTPQAESTENTGESKSSGSTAGKGNVKAEGEVKDAKPRGRPESNRVGTAKAVTAGSFWQSAAAYFDPITDEDMALLTPLPVPSDPYVRKKQKMNPKMKRPTSSMTPNGSHAMEIDSDAMDKEASDDDPDMLRIIDFGPFTRRLLSSLIHDKDVTAPHLDRPLRTASGALDLTDPYATDFPLYLPPILDVTPSLSTLESGVERELLLSSLFSEREILNSSPHSLPPFLSPSDPHTNIGTPSFWSLTCWGVDMGDNKMDEEAVVTLPVRKRREERKREKREESDSSEESEEEFLSRVSEKGREGEEREGRRSDLQELSERIKRTQKKLRDQVLLNNLSRAHLKELTEERREQLEKIEKKRKEWEMLEANYVKMVKKTPKKRKKKT